MSLQRDVPPDQQLFDALSGSTRRTILELLAANGPMTASEIYGNFDMTNPAVSQHLKVLRDSKLVQFQKDAQKHVYSLNPEKMRDVENWIKETTDLWSQRFDRLDQVLEAEKRRGGKRR